MNRKIEGPFQSVSKAVRSCMIATKGFFQSDLYRMSGGYIVCAHCGNKILSGQHIVLYPVSICTLTYEGLFQVEDPETQEMFLAGCVTEGCKPWNGYPFGKWSAEKGFIPVADFIFGTARLFGKIAIAIWKDRERLSDSKEGPITRRIEREDDTAVHTAITVRLR